MNNINENTHLNTPHTHIYIDDIRATETTHINTQSLEKQDQLTKHTIVIFLFFSLTYKQTAATFKTRFKSLKQQIIRPLILSKRQTQTHAIHKRIHARSRQRCRITSNEHHWNQICQYACHCTDACQSRQFRPYC